MACQCYQGPASDPSNSGHTYSLSSCVSAAAWVVHVGAGSQVLPQGTGPEPVYAVRLLIVEEAMGLEKQKVLGA